MKQKSSLFSPAKLLAASVFLCSLALTGDETHLFNSAEDWTPSNRVSVNKDKSIAIKGMGVLFSHAEPFAVDPTAVSTLSGEFKAMPGTNPKDRYYVAFLNFDKDMKRIETCEVNTVKGTETTLAADVDAKDKTVKIKDGSKFKKGMYIAFNAKKDFSDLPNRSVNARAAIQDVKLLADGSYLLTFKHAIAFSAKAGTPVRAHRGGWYQYSGPCGEKVPQEWKKFSVDIKGTAPGDHKKIWRPGTAFAKIVIFGAGPSKVPFLAFRNVKFESRGGKKVPAVNKTVIPAKTKSVILDLPVKKDGVTLQLYFADGSKRSVAVRPQSMKYQYLELKNAFLSVSPFPFTFKMVNVPAVPPRKKKVEDLEKIWKECSASMDKSCRITIMDTAKGPEVYLNGSFTGIIKRSSPLTAISGIPGGVKAIFCDKAAPSYRKLDLSYASKISKAKSAEYKNILDLGITAKKQKSSAKVPADGLRSFGKMTSSFVWTVPAEQYPAAKVICAVDPDRKKDPAMTLRLTRYVDHTGYKGRAFEAMSDTLVEFPEAVKKGLAKEMGKTVINGKNMSLYEVTVPLNSGDIADLVYTDNNSTFPMSNARYLDFEIMGRCINIRHPMGDKRAYPDPAKTSGIYVMDIALERAKAEMEPCYAQPGNIFHNDEKPEARMRIKPLLKGNYTLSWTIRDVDGNIVKKDAKKLSGNKEEIVKINLAQKELGWYALNYELKEGARVLLTHKASFALLDKDTRKAEVADSPYGCWDYGGAHYNADKLEIVGPVLYKAGFRRSAGIQKYPLAQRKKWKLEAASIGSAPMGSSDEKQIETIRKNLEKSPNVKQFLIFHEHAKWSYQVAPELTGQKYDPKNKWVDAEKRQKHAMQLGRIVRKHFPQLRILLGNSLGCTELIAETIRGGFPEKYADYVGLEVVGRNNLPERQWESSLQAGELLRDTARAFGYNKWKIGACFENNYRLDSLIGDERQAQWYVRDLLLAQAWRIPDIFIGIIMDCGNSYAGSFWGATGLCYRNPYIYPKKAYVGVAVATRLLDQVTDCKRIPAGDECVYLVEYKRKDGNYVYALWSSVLDTPVAIKTNGNKFEKVDFYGRKKEGKVGVFNKSFDAVATQSAQYFVSSKPLILSAKASEAVSGAKRPADHKVAAKADSMAAWKIADGKDIRLEKPTGLYMPYRTAGKFAAKEVTDPVMGKCIEITLAKPDLKLNKHIWEYGILELKKPVVLANDPASLGVTVKGNSRWGQIYFVVEDATGKRMVSCGTRQHNADVYDYDGRTSLAYTGWNYVTMPMTAKSSIIDISTGAVSNLWEAGIMKDGKFKTVSTSVKYPVKLVGVAFAVQSRVLSLTERSQMEQTFRIKEVSSFDFQKK